MKLVLLKYNLFYDISHTLAVREKDDHHFPKLKLRNNQ